MLLKRQIWMLLIVFCCTGSWAQEVSEHSKAFAAGLKAFQEEQYDSAVAAFEQSLAGEQKSAEAYNNLGLAYFKKGDLGHAVLNFERALRHSRYHADARHNLKAARQHIDSNLKAVKPFWFFRLWNNIALGLPSTVWAIVLWFFLFGAAAGFIFWYNSPNKKTQQLGFKVGLGLAIAALFPFVWGFQALHQETNTKEVIITSSKAGIRTNPTISGEDIMVVHAGVKAEIKDQTEDWYRIRLANGVLGWIPEKMVTHIIETPKS